MTLRGFGLALTFLMWGCAKGGLGVRPDAGGPQGCQTNEMMCGEECVDTQFDSAHCGGCGQACLDTETCAFGVCVLACPDQQSACDVGGVAQCVSTQSNPSHCGGCNQPCAQGQVCSRGQCSSSCEAGQMACTLPAGGTACANLRTDPAHCAGCNRGCASGERCVDANCVFECTAPQTACGSTCVNTETDRNNCGECAHGCAADQVCSNSVCVRMCPSGQQECDGACRDTQNDPAHCGRCEAPCGEGQACTQGVCGSQCFAGEVVCGASCVRTDSDALNCNGCGLVCQPPIGGSASCENSSCVASCPAGRTNCSGTCRDLRGDASSCGACGQACSASEVCENSSCVMQGTPLGGATLRITGLDGAGAACTTTRQDTVAGNDFGGIAVSGSQVFVAGSRGVARFARNNLSSGTLIPGSLYAMFSDLQTDTAWTLANDSGPIVRGGGLVTQLLRLNDDGQLDGTGIRLSQAISATSGSLDSNVGIFSGYGRLGIHNGTRMYVVRLATGQVTDLGPMAIPPRRRCETWAYWGLLEHDATDHWIVFAEESARRISRRRVRDGLSAEIAALALGDMCSINAGLPAGQWYFHSHKPWALATTELERSGYCDASFSTTSGFRIVSLSLNNCQQVAHASVTGDYHGGIASGPNALFVTGDTTSATIDVNGAVRMIGAAYDMPVSDLRTGKTYVFANGGVPLSRRGGVATQLIGLVDTSGVIDAARITLSSPITIPALSAGVGFYSGWDRVVVHTGSRVFHVSMPSGMVTDVGAMAAPSRTRCVNGANWGVAEYWGQRLRLVYVASATEVRRVTVPTGATEVVSTQTNLADMCSFVYVPALGRWYFSLEGTSQFATTSGVHVGFCGGRHDQP